MVQTYFDENFGILISPDLQKNYRVEVFNEYPYLQCPYCLFGSKSMNDFLVVGKHRNISKKMALCPKCHNTLRRSTLVSTGKMDLEQYGSYLAGLANWDVDKRVKWSLIFNVLKSVSSEERSKLWIAYRKRKSEINPDYAARKEVEEYGNMSQDQINEENRNYNEYRKSISESEHNPQNPS